MVDLAKRGPMALNGITASEAARRLDVGEITSEALVRDCLARIEARDPEVEAWDHLDPDHAVAEARRLDATPRKSPLHGVPIGIKDIFDTEDMPTAHGFPPYKGVNGGYDSACVAALRKAGMLIMGKTVTTQFACGVPRHTHNPHHHARSPGVSSSGSAAAVADFMVPLANGSQTGGSVVVPAACCGVYGFKASLDGIDRGGFRHCKQSIDTIGLFARTIDDIQLLRKVQTGKEPATALDRDTRVRIGVVRTAEWDKVEPFMQRAFERAASMLAVAGADVSDVTLPQLFSDIVPEFSVVNGWESAAMLASEIRDNYEAIIPHLRERVEFVRTLTEGDYQRGKSALTAARREMNALISGYDVFISPSQGGEAPAFDRESQPQNYARLWTQMYVPAVNLPLFTGPSELPLGFQVIGPNDRDGRTLAVAAWIDRRLREALGTVPAAA